VLAGNAPACESETEEGDENRTAAAEVGGSVLWGVPETALTLPEPLKPAPNTAPSQVE